MTKVCKDFDEMRKTDEVAIFVISNCPGLVVSDRDVVGKRTSLGKVDHPNRGL